MEPPVGLSTMTTPSRHDGPRDVNAAISTTAILLSTSSSCVEDVEEKKTKRGIVATSHQGAKACRSSASNITGSTILPYHVREYFVRQDSLLGRKRKRYPMSSQSHLLSSEGEEEPEDNDEHTMKNHDNVIGWDDDVALPYDSKVPPRVHDSEWTPVQMGLKVFKIQSIEIATAKLKLNIWLRLSWKDPRLAWDPNDERYRNVTQTTYKAHHLLNETGIWVPDLELINQDESIATSLAPKDAQVFPDGTVFWSRLGTLHALCAFSGLRMFPMDDSSECTVDFSGWTRSGRFANYQFMSPPVLFANESTSTTTARTTYQEYVLVPSKTRSSIFVYYYPCCPDEPWPTPTHTFVFARDAVGYYYRTVLIPVIALTCLSFCSFWCPPHCDERLLFGITILVSVIAVEIIATMSALPTCGEVIWMEGVIFGSMLFVLASLFESAAATHYYYRSRIPSRIREKEKQQKLHRKVNIDKKGQQKYEQETSTSPENNNNTCQQHRYSRYITSVVYFAEGEKWDEEKREEVEDENDIQSPIYDNGMLSNSTPLQKPQSPESSSLPTQQEQQQDCHVVKTTTKQKKVSQHEQLDYWSRRLFLPAYIIFLLIMHVSVPLWRDDFQIQHGNNDVVDSDSGGSSSSSSSGGGVDDDFV